MKRIKPGYWIFIFCVICFLGLSGCISLSNSPTARFYALETMDRSQPVDKFDIPSNIMIGIGPVSIPEYLNRPQIVTQNQDKTLAFAQFDRWGEPLDLALERTICENLRILLPGVVVEIYPWNVAIPVKYRVIVDFIQLASELKNDLSLVAQWSVIDLKNNKIVLIKRVDILKPIKPQNYSGLVKTLSLGCASLSSQIASDIASLEQKSEAKESVPLSAQK
jgi:uncharacterized protein